MIFFKCPEGKNHERMNQLLNSGLNLKSPIKREGYGACRTMTDADSSNGFFRIARLKR